MVYLLVMLFAQAQTGDLVSENDHFRLCEEEFQSKSPSTTSAELTSFRGNWSKLINEKSTNWVKWLRISKTECRGDMCRVDFQSDREQIPKFSADFSAWVVRNTRCAFDWTGTALDEGAAKGPVTMRLYLRSCDAK
ncbi:MAG: hypothetical protein AAF654_13025 [Myxococcota bacterium]